MNILDQAIIFALTAHEGQTRKKENIPYILHPLEAAAIAATLTSDPEVLAAVVLHDTVEDTDVTIEQIRELFGERVARLVAGETEQEYADMPREESWKLRKQRSLDHLRCADDENIRIMWLADKLSNIRSLYRMYLTEGEAMWQNFNQRDPGQQEWYYRSVADALSSFADAPAYREYVRLTDSIFGGEK